jgi:hypothetical protein
MKPVGIVSDVIPAGISCTLLVLIPPGLVAYDRAYTDPPTAAAFTIERVDPLDEGETYALAGHRVESVRLEVRNRSSAPAVFRGEIPVCHPGEHPAMLARELPRIAEAGWRDAHDRAKASN